MQRYALFFAVALRLCAADYTALDRYVAAPDDSYRYQLFRTIPAGDLTIYQLDLVSQTWLTAAEVDRPEWHHWLTIMKPAAVKAPAAALYINGGSNKATPDAPNPLLTAIAAQSGAVAIELDRWPARLPMTKAVVRAMDAATDFLSKLPSGAATLDKFVVAGVSKRGWTAWTGAPAIRDYERAGVMNWIGTPQLASLLDIEDPYRYRERLTLPKYMINSTGDQFFLPDSSQFYFRDLPGEKYLRFVPNTDHNLAGIEAPLNLTARERDLYGEHAMLPLPSRIERPGLSRKGASQAGYALGSQSSRYRSRLVERNRNSASGAEKDNAQIQTGSREALDCFVRYV